MSGSAGISLDDVTSTIENAVYTAVGLGVLGFNHLQVQRRELSRQVGDAVRAVNETVGEHAERLAGDR
jgi:hypothetical protein